MDENDNQNTVQGSSEPVAPASMPVAESPNTPGTATDIVRPDITPPGTTRSILDAPTADPPTFASSESEAQAAAPLAPQEVEPNTQPISSPAVPVAAPQTAEPATQPQTAPIATSNSLSEKSAAKKKPLTIIAGAGVLLLALAGAVIWWLFADGTPSSNQINDLSSASSMQAKLGVAVTVADGTVQYLQDDTQWQTLTADTELREGDSVRTGADGRTVLTLDDGSAVRLDTNTTVELKNLAADNVQITQVAGTVYSRVVASERKYSVIVDDASYEALGTAFSTVKTNEAIGVQVYQSSVKATGAAEEVDEGKQYYSANSNSALVNTVTSINLDELADNTFIAWNLTQDEMDAKFRDKLGVLADVKQKSEEKLRQSASEYTDQLKREREAADKKEKQEQNKNEKVSRGNMELWIDDGSALTWSYSGKAIHGFKVVHSASSKTPTFGKDQAIYVSDPNSTRLTLPKEITEKKGTHYIRVCAYTAGSEDEPCVDYSAVKEVIVHP